MNRLFVFFLICEVAYVTAVRILAHYFGGSMLHLEIWWTLIRLVSAFALTVVFLRLNDADPAKTERVPARCAIAAGMFLAPVLVGNMGLVGADRYFFAATSVVVGLREELAYRGILQRFLTPRMGIAGSLFASNGFFVLYHWGIQPFTPHYVLQLFLCGMILGVVYHLTGSMVLVVALHAVYNAIDSFSPYLDPRLPDFVCTVVLSLTLGALLVTGKWPNKSTTDNSGASSHRV